MELGASEKRDERQWADHDPRLRRKTSSGNRKDVRR